MDWVEVEVEDNCSILCAKCNAELAEIKDIDVYAAMSDYIEAHNTYLFLKTNHIGQSQFRLDDAKITNKKAVFLMYLQVIRCSSCLNQIGTYFKTANADNKFALGRFALDIKFIRIADNHEMTLAMFAQALKTSMQSMTKKEIPEKSELNKLGKYKIVQTFRTIKGSYAKLEEMINTEVLKVLKEQLKQEISNHQDYRKQQQ